MRWNWQQADWPNFSYESGKFAKLETVFLKGAGVVLGTCEHLASEEAQRLKIELISTEAIKTSAIEGEVLDRDGVQSSLKRHFGLQSDHKQIPERESGIAELMVDLYTSAEKSLTHELLFSWHRMVMAGSRDVRDIGRYRTHDEAMQVVSGPIEHRRIHFEAPPSERVGSEMDGFIKWFNETRDLPALVRGGLAHLYFVSVHPFEDGNGRIARALSEKALAQAIGEPTLTALSYQIESERKEYYKQLELANKDLEVTKWLEYFCGEVLAAQEWTLGQVRFLVEKAKLHDRLRGRLNQRQEKVLERMFREGPEGFKGGLSAEKYTSIAKCSRATTTRDLADLVSMGALEKSGQLKGTRYSLAVTVAR
jgi:Fic family protein